MKPTTIYLPEETEASLQELANRTGKSLPELITSFEEIVQQIRQEAEQNGLTPEILEKLLKVEITIIE